MSTPVTVNIPHSLGKAEARRRVDQSFGDLQDQLTGYGLKDVERGWTEDTLAFSARGLGQTIAGRLNVLEDALRIEIDLPGFLGSLAERLTGSLERKGRLMLEKK